MKNKNLAQTKLDRDHAEEIFCTCIGARMRAITRAVSAIYEDAMRPYRIRFSQMNILVATMQTGETLPAELSRMLQLDHSTVSRGVGRMTERGWLETLENEDGRLAPVRVTKKGQALVAKAYPAWKEAQQQACKLVGPEFESEIHATMNTLLKTP